MLWWPKLANNAKYAYLLGSRLVSLGHIYLDAVRKALLEIFRIVAI